MIFRSIQLLREGRAMDIRSIQRALHRYPMLLVDRVLELDGDQKAIGIKNVSINEPFFQGHYPNVPIMPGVLIVEAMAQLGGSGLQHDGHTGRLGLLSLDRVKIRKPVTPVTSWSWKQRQFKFGPESFRSAVEQPWREPLAEARIRFVSSRRTASIDA